MNRVRSVTNHAVVRYIERCEGIDLTSFRIASMCGKRDGLLLGWLEDNLGFPVEALRTHIAELVASSVAIGACGLKTDSGIFVFIDGHVTSVLPAGGRAKKKYGKKKPVLDMRSAAA